MTPRHDIMKVNCGLATICNGDRLFCGLVGIDAEVVGHGVQNTSVTSVKLEPDGKRAIDFQNRTHTSWQLRCVISGVAFGCPVYLKKRM